MNNLPNQLSNLPCGLKKSVMLFPQRKNLPHTPPVSVSQYATDAMFYITICVNRNKYNIRANETGKCGPLIGHTSVRLLCAIEHYRATKQISPILTVIMPDHIHIIAKFPQESSMTKFVANFKRWTASDCHVIWQDSFFDHRLRSENEINEKRDYVLRNPERKGLCENFTDWPYRMEWM